MEDFEARMLRLAREVAKLTAREGTPPMSPAPVLRERGLLLRRAMCGLLRRVHRRRGTVGLFSVVRAAWGEADQLKVDLRVSFDARRVNIL